jgi:transposase
MTKCFAGLDWASQIHRACVVDVQGSVITEFDAHHTAAGLAQLCSRLKAAGVTAVAIERPSGMVVDALIEAGFQVVPIHPNVVKATRPRYRSHGGKSDASDAYLLADLLRTDGHRFAPLAPECDEIRALQALVRMRDELVATRVQQGNQLRALLDSFWPGAAAIFADVDSPIALAFLQRYPTPASARSLGRGRMAAFCAKHAYSGRRSPEELLARLHQAPTVALGSREMQAKGALAGTLARVLSRLVEELSRLTRQVEHCVQASDDGRILMSFPRAGRVCAAQILAELGSVRERFDSADRLAALAGVTPVTKESGKYRFVAFRWACNHRLRAAVTCLADNSRHASAWAADIYDRARARGCDHQHAIRVLARAWLRVIWRAWTDRQPYDAERHVGAMLHLASTGG